MLSIMLGFASGVWATRPVIAAGQAAPPPLLEMLGLVLAQLPADVEVRPTEHYYYWQQTVDGQPVRGNLRFANGLRERGELSFSYTSATGGEDAHCTAADGVQLTCEDAFTVRLAFRGSTVRFHLHQLAQTPPPAGVLRPEEQFVERTCDDSGLQFYLIYNRGGNFFNWLLDQTTPGNFTSLAGAWQLETRTGFVFQSTGARQLLVGVARAAVLANSAADGPFDQLADNYALTSGRQALLEKAVPECAGRIDAWGNYLHVVKARRVALVPYFLYTELTALCATLAAAPADGLERYVSRLGQP